MRLLVPSKQDLMIGLVLFRISRNLCKVPTAVGKSRRKLREESKSTMDDLDRNSGQQAPSEDKWMTVNKKKSSLSKEKLIEKMTTMKKSKVTIMIRVSSDTAADYSAAEVHVATFRELGKQDANMIVLDHKGTSQVNIHQSFRQEKYIEMFQPREKPFRNGPIQVSIAHHVLSDMQNFSKALLLHFLKKNVFIFFNQKDGLEHFTAIRVLFGPHPELAWRQAIVEHLEIMMKVDMNTPKDCQKLQSTIQEPNIIISIVPQQISNP